jgi:hypothetical protein
MAGRKLIGGKTSEEAFFGGSYTQTGVVFKPTSNLNSLCHFHP